LRNWEDIHALHVRAADALAAKAMDVPADRWLKPRAEGKWSPAEVVEHLNRVYDVVLNEIAGAPGMQIKTALWQRVLLRFTMVPKILRGDGFPEGARAPKETRPVVSIIDQREAVDGFRERAKRFAEDVQGARNRGQRLTHAYFGKMSAIGTTLLLARHIEHHMKQIS